MAMRRKLPPWLVLLLVLASVPVAWRTTARADSPLQVPFVLVRLDRSTLQMLRAYRFDQPFRKSLQAPCSSPIDRCLTVGDVFAEVVEPIDYGHTELRSRLTGQVIFRAGTVWSGVGTLEWPTEAEGVPPGRGAPAPDPLSFTHWSPWGASYLPESRAREAWEVVRDLQAVSDLASLGPFEVFVTHHDYSVPFPGPMPPELLVFVFGRPVAPRDMGLLRMRWPRGVLSRGVSSAPQVTVHNFADEAIDAEVELEVVSNGTLLLRSRRTVESLAADATVRVDFDTFAASGESPVLFRARLRDAGEGWVDAFADNDRLDEAVVIVDLPVFRALPSGTLPSNGWLVDFDGDGDQDVVRQAGSTAAFRRNDGGGHFTTLAEPAVPRIPSFPRDVVPADVSGDGRPETVIVIHDEPLILVAYDGSALVDVTQTSGLGSRAAKQVLPFDADGDGDLDLAGFGKGVYFLMLNDGHGQFTNGTAAAGLGGAAKAIDLAAGRLDTDDREDLVAVMFGAPTRLLRGLGQGAFQEVGSLPGTDTYWKATLLDYDAVGLTDLILGGYTHNRLFRQRTSMNFTDVTPQAGPLGRVPFALQMDLEGDGFTDLVLTEPHRIAHNVAGVFQDEARLLGFPDEPVPWFQSGSRVQAVDLDQDGDSDLYYPSVTFENLGRARPTLEPAVDVMVSTDRRGRGSSSGGLISVVVHGSATLPVEQIDLGRISFGPERAPLAHQGCPHIADMDLDGRKDLLSHFAWSRTGLTPGDRGCLEAFLLDGTLIRGCSGQ